MISIHDLFSGLNSDQWAFIAALAISSPVAQYALTEYNDWLNDPKRKDFKKNLNWVLGFAFPALGTIATFLVTNPQVSTAFPIFAILYTVGTGIYLGSLRFARRVRQYKELYESSTAPEQL